MTQKHQHKAKVKSFDIKKFREIDYVISSCQNFVGVENSKKLLKVDSLNNSSPKKNRRMSNIYIVTFLVGLILTSVFIILHKQTNAIAITGLTKQGNRLPTFIITGLSNSGKTALFTKVSFSIHVSYNELVPNCCL